MTRPNQLLVVIDADTDVQPALARAVSLAAKSHASVTALLCIYDFAYEMTTMLSVDERSAMRKAVLAERHEWACSIAGRYRDALPDPNTLNVNVIWDNRQYEAIIQYAQDCGADLIVKSASSHDDLSSLIFTPTDWHILRKAPVPVLMVKGKDWPAEGNIIAAVNVGTQDAEHAQLNDTVVRVAQHYATLMQGNVHLANAFPGAPVNIAIEISDFDAKGYNNSVHQHHLNEMTAFSQTHHIKPAQCHIEQGLPEKVIPALAKTLDAELVVIGTIGRVGLSAAFIGNTAEHVIDELNCDVLAVKP